MPFTIKAISNILKIRRFYVDPAITYDALVNAIATGFGCEDPSNAKLCISYIDCERDFVSITNTDDLRVAIDLFQEKQFLKLFVSPCCQPIEGAGACGSLTCSKGKCGEEKCGKGKCGEGKCGKGKCGEGKCGKGKCGDKDCCPALKAILCRKKTACNYFRAKFPCINQPAGPCAGGPGGPPEPCPGPPCTGFPGFGGPCGKGFGGPCGGGKKFCLKKWFKKLRGLRRRGGFGKCGPCSGPCGGKPCGGPCGGRPCSGPCGGGPCGGKPCGGKFGKRRGFKGWGRSRAGSDSSSDGSSSSSSSSSSSGSGSYSSSGEY